MLGLGGGGLIKMLGPRPYNFRKIKEMPYARNNAIILLLSFELAYLCTSATQRHMKESQSIYVDRKLEILEGLSPHILQGGYTTPDLPKSTPMAKDVVDFLNMILELR